MVGMAVCGRVSVCSGRRSSSSSGVNVVEYALLLLDHRTPGGLAFGRHGWRRLTASQTAAG